MKANSPEHERITWAPKVRQAKIWQLYQNDALGAVDEALVEDVGYRLLQRCRSIQLATARGLLGLSENPYVILLLLNLLLIVAGMLLDAISIYYVFLPILLPLVQRFHWDPVWFGVMVTVNLAIGTVTPPVAVNLYVASNIARTSIEEIARWAVPFVLALMAALLLVTYVPALSLWLPDLLGVR